MANKVAEGIDCEIPVLPKPRFNMTPSEDGIIVRLNEAGEMYASIAKWGFYPSWMKEQPEQEPERDLLGDAKKPRKKKRSTKEGWSIARGDTVDKLGIFKSAFKHKRCLILIDGFFEWDPKVQPKQPYFIHRPDDGIFAVAGIWEMRVRADGEEELNYAMITTEPNGMMDPIHNRMPVILAVKDYRIWLNPKTDIGVLKGLLVPCPNDLLVAYPISRRINSPANDSPDLLRPE